MSTLEITHQGKKIGLNDLLHIRGARPGDQARVIGMPVGETNAPNMRHARDVITAAQAFIDRAHAVRTNDLLTPPERGVRIKEMAPLAALETAARAIAGDRAKLVQEMSTLRAAPAYANSEPHKAWWDIRLVDALNELEPVPRASRLAELMANPLVDLDTADALMRVPLAITKLTVQEASTLRMSMIKRLKSDVYERLDMERQQLTLAETSVRVAVEEVGKTLGTYEDLRTSAPTALAMHTDTSVVSWT